jgi:hypothetical protein
MRTSAAMLFILKRRRYAQSKKKSVLKQCRVDIKAKVVHSRLK